jgi:hypothetical protein
VLEEPAQAGPIHFELLLFRVAFRKERQIMP